MAAQKTFAPQRAVLWTILNASHIGLDKILEEFLDNAVSAHAHDIRIDLIQTTEDGFTMTVEDDGDGIAEEALTWVFGVGHQPGKSVAGDHNQFGIGLKSALASCDYFNETWAVYSRVAGRPGQYVRVQAPYREEGIDYAVCRTEEEPWPGEISSGTGTLISVPVTKTLFKSLDPKWVKTDAECIAALAEELAVTYGPMLQDVHMTLHWQLLSGEEGTRSIEPIRPNWKQIALEEKGEELNLGRGKLVVDYTMGAVAAHPDTQKYYKCNITSSGLMVYLNGRLIQANLFKEVWNQPHPTYNPFLLQVNLRMVDGNREALPSPTPDKDYMVLGDPRFIQLLSWVRKLCPDPKACLPKTQKESAELAMCRQMAEHLKDSGAASVANLEMPLPLVNKKAIRTDLYTRLPDGRAVLYETKAQASKVLDLAQLAMYGLIAAEDGLDLDELVLVAKSHGSNVQTFAQMLGRRWFRGLSVPKIRLLTWEEVQNGGC